MKKIIIVLLVATLLLTACGTISGGTTSASSNDMSGALNTLLGTTDKPSVFDSYHLEMVLDTPKANDDSTAVVNEKTSISADIAGKNIHIFQIDPGMTDPKEGYIIGDTDKEFKLVDGSWQETMGQIALAWAMWPLQVVMPYSYSTSVYAHKAGTEAVDGRNTTVYKTDTTKAEPAMIASMKAFGLGNFNSKGQVWIDNETGAMLKLKLDYTEDIMNSDASKAIGQGTGSITMEVSKVGQVIVTSPQ